MRSLHKLKKIIKPNYITQKFIVLYFSAEREGTLCLQINLIAGLNTRLQICAGHNQFKTICIN